MPGNHNQRNDHTSENFACFFPLALVLTLLNGHKPSLISDIYGLKFFDVFRVYVYIIFVKEIHGGFHDYKGIITLIR